LETAWDFNMESRERGDDDGTRVMLASSPIFGDEASSCNPSSPMKQPITKKAVFGDEACKESFMLPVVGGSFITDPPVVVPE
jgi:hypothetical protein